MPDGTKVVFGFLPDIRRPESHTTRDRTSVLDACIATNFVLNVDAVKAEAGAAIQRNTVHAWTHPTAKDSARLPTLRGVVPIEQVQPLLPDAAPHLDGVADLERFVGVAVEGGPFGQP